MGELFGFKRRQSWTRIQDYGRRPDGPRFWPPPRRRFPFKRPVALLLVLAGAYAASDPDLVEPPELLSGEPELVKERFTRCGPGRGHACVIDGDTFKLGSRKIRIVGIDAPEVKAQCAQEARLAELATAMLQRELNEAPFEMLAPLTRSYDKYGRDLRVLRRKQADGSYGSIADDLRRTGLVHRYAGFKTGWC